MNKKMLMAIGAALAFGALVVGWLIFGGKAVRVPLAKNTHLEMAATLKNSVISRESEGKKLWDFTVADTKLDKIGNTLIFEGIKGKSYQSDGGVIDISADKGRMVQNKNDFTLQGHVKAQESKGTTFTCDKISYKAQKNKKDAVITAVGHVVMTKDDRKASADWATTTTAFEAVKLKGHAKVVKGGK